MVEGGEAAGDEICLLEGSGRCRNEAGVGRRNGDRRQQGRGVERSDRVAALERLDPHVEDGEVIGHEEGVELSALERLGGAHKMREVEIRVRKSARVASRDGVDRRRSHEGAELHLTLRGHAWFFQRSRPRPPSFRRTSLLSQ
jgi:hypothetical protein